MADSVEFRMLPDWESRVIDSLLPRLRELGFKMLEGAIEDCPVDRGSGGRHMRNQMNMSVSNKGVITLGNDAPYALFVEMGHFIPVGSTPDKTAPSGFVQPQPFLRPQLYRYWGAI